MREGGLPYILLHFVRHAGGDPFLAIGQIGNRLEIRPIAENDLAFANRLDGSKRAMLAPAGTYSNDIQFSRAMATVTPCSICLSSNSCVLLPANRAAGSATAGKSTFS